MQDSANHCQQLEEDLALLAGGDLAADSGQARENELRTHLSACEGCFELFEALGGDQAIFQSLAAMETETDAESILAASVVARLERTEAPAPALRRSRRQTDWAHAVAAVLVLGFATLIGMQAGILTDAGESQSQSAQAAAEAARVDDGSLRLTRSSGGAVELRWRQSERTASAELQTPYRVLASDDPRFAASEALEVAGLALVDSRPGRTSTRSGDARALTFYKVQ